MDPHSFIARAEAQRWLGIAEKLLMGHDLVGSKTFAIRARESDPRLEAAEQILTVADTLLAAEKRVVGSNGSQQPDFYAILQLVRFVQDTEHIAAQYRRLHLLLNPHQNRFPYSDQAFQLVNDAWTVLSNPMRKSMYDAELNFSAPQQMSIGFNLEQHHHQQHHHQHQQQQQHNFFSIPNHIGSGHEQELPEPPQTFQTRAQQSHQQQQLQQHNFLSQPNPIRPVPVREQEQLFQPQVQPFLVKSPQQQPRPSPQPRMQSPPPPQSRMQSPPPPQQRMQSPPPPQQRMQSPPPTQQRIQSSPPPAAPTQPSLSWSQTQSLSQQPQTSQQSQPRHQPPKQQLQQPQHHQQRQEQLSQQQRQEQLSQQQRQEQLSQQQRQEQLPQQQRQEQLSQQQRQEQFTQQQQQEQRLQQKQQQEQRLQKKQLQQEQQLLEERRQEQQQLLEERRHQQQQEQSQQQQEEQSQQQLRRENVAPIHNPKEVSPNNGAREEERETVAAANVNQSSTFWTACPYCYYMYEYPGVYVDCTLRCDNCKRAFQAVPIEDPPPTIEGKEAYFCCWGFFPIGVSMPHLEKNKGTPPGSRWAPFSPLYDATNSVQDHLNDRAVPKGNFNGKRSSGPHIYIDDFTDDVFMGISEPSEDSDIDWGSNRKKKVKRVKRMKKTGLGYEIVPQVLGVRRRGRPKGSKNLKPKKIKNLQDGIPVQEGVTATTAAMADGSKKDQQVSGVRKRGRPKGSKNSTHKRDKNPKDGISVQEGVTATPVAVAESSKKPAGANPRRQSGRVVKELGKLDLNVEFNNNEGEEPGSGMTAGNQRGHGHGEEDNIEGIGFFEGLDEFLSSLPILSVVNDEKVKAA